MRYFFWFFKLSITLSIVFTSNLFSQEINIKTYKTHYGNGDPSTYSSVTYEGLAYSHAELDAMIDVNQPGTTEHYTGTINPFSSNIFILLEAVSICGYSLFQ